MPKPVLGPSSGKRERGLKSVHAMREQRIAGRFARPTEKMWLAAGVALLAIVGAYGFFASRSLERKRTDLLAKRNAVVSTLGAEWYPLRDRLERLVVAEGAQTEAHDYVDPRAKAWDFQRRPGLYLRLRAADARDNAAIRKAADGSLRDGFVGCLIVSPNAALARGEADAGAFGENPWNLRQAYAATRILTDDWAREVRESGDDLRLRVFLQQFDKAETEEIPLAARILKQADFFLFVLDGDVDDPRARIDGGPLTVEGLELVPHPARVVLVDLRQSDAVVLRISRAAQAGFRFVGDSPVRDPETLDAMQRQVNNCQLAGEVKAALR